MTKQRYVMWMVDGVMKVRLPTQIVGVMWNPGREMQLQRLVASWQEVDARMGIDGQTGQTDHTI